MTRLAHHPRRQARLDLLALVLRLGGPVHRDALPALAEGLRCTHRALLCDVLALKRAGLVVVDGAVLTFNPAAATVAAAA